MIPDGTTCFSVTALSANAAAVVTMPKGEAEGCEGEESSSVSVVTPDGWVSCPPVPWFTVACLVTEKALVGVGQYGHLQHLPWAGGEIRVTELPTTPALPLRVQGARRVGGLLGRRGVDRPQGLRHLVPVLPGRVAERRPDQVEPSKNNALLPWGGVVDVVWAYPTRPACSSRIGSRSCCRI